MNNKFLENLSEIDLKDVIKDYYSYSNQQLKTHCSKWLEVKTLGQQNMITHDDINDLICETYKESFTLLTQNQKLQQELMLLESLDHIINSPNNRNLENMKNTINENIEVFYKNKNIKKPKLK